MPLVSVIIPAYNAASTIERTIESVRRQTLGDFEVVVIDDGSTDVTAACVRAIGDSRIRVLSFSNAGLPTARNRGIAASRGEYLAFLDADDLWSRNKLESHVAVMQQRPEIGAVYSWTCSIDEDDVVLGQQNTATWEGDVYAPMLAEFFIGNASNTILRRRAVESVGLFDAGLRSGEDWEFLVRVASQYRFAVVPQYYVFYRWRVGSISCDVDRMRDGLLIVCDRNFTQAPAGLQSLKPVSLANIHLYIARTCLARSSQRAAIDEAARSLRAVLALRPRMMFDPTALRLCVRWLIARIFSLQTASRAASYYQSVRFRNAAHEIDPWA